jgi:SAM-dependent methyltransferase
MSSPEDLAANVAAWTRRNSEYLDGAAAAAWSREEIVWGMFEIPESDLGILGDVAGLDVVELGCGTAYFSAWLAKRGARPVGVDPTPAQLDTALRLMVETRIEFPLVEAPGERVPLPDASFDLALSEHGAATWANPHRWISEAARLLRPGGRLVFLHSSPFTDLCYPDEGEITTSLQRPYFGLGRMQWDETEGVEYQLTHGDWVAVIVGAGLVVERLVELQPPEGARKHEYYGDIPVGWARQWPAEEVWIARKPA